VGHTLQAFIAATLLLLAAATACAAGGDPAAGKRKTVTCNGCHGQAGMKSMPSLGGQHPDYFVAAMEAYQDGVRPHPTMRDVAKAFSLRDFKNFAAYYAESTAATAASSGEPAPAAAEPCAACHGSEGGDPQTPVTPRLAGQKAPYLEQALRDYREGVRKHAIMGPQAASLSDDDIAALTAYFSSRPGLFVK
jgi:cytochrome c553